MSEIIKTENLQYAYPAEDGQLSVPVLKGVNLSIRRKEQFHMQLFATRII